MEDIIDYKIPLGFLGTLAHPIVVKPQLTKIFSYREAQLKQRFGSIPNYQTTVTMKSI